MLIANPFIRNIAQLVTARGRQHAAQNCLEMQYTVIEHAGVLCRDGKIAWMGRMNDFQEALPDDMPELDGSESVAFPGFVDSHTHMMFAGDRAGEFALRSRGASYQDTAAAGGEIISTIRECARLEKGNPRSTPRYLPR